MAAPSRSELMPAAPGAVAAGQLGLTLSAMIASADGLVVLRHELSGDHPEELGRAMARYLLDDAGGSRTR